MAFSLQHGALGIEGVMLMLLLQWHNVLLSDYIFCKGYSLPLCHSFNIPITISSTLLLFFNISHFILFVFANLSLSVTQCTYCSFLSYQRVELHTVYHVELHVAVNSIPKRFVKSNVVYFLRNTRGQ